MLQKDAILEVPLDTLAFYSNMFLVCATLEGWRPVIDLKQLNAQHNSFLHGYHCLNSEYCKKQRLCVQNRSGGCVLSCINPPRQPEVPLFHLYMNKVCQFISYHSLLGLVVDLFMWLHSQDIVLRARHIPGCHSVVSDHLLAKSADNHGMMSLSRGNDSDLRVVGSPNSGQVCHSPQLSSAPVHVSNSRASSTGSDLGRDG